MKNDPIQAALNALDDPAADLAKALASKYPLVAARAARLARERGRNDLAPRIAAALDVLLAAKASADKGCSAKEAMARALVAFDHDDGALFLKGMRHVQLEPVWGGSEDSAAELRGVCAMGLANSSWPDKLQDLTELLVDKQWPARAGAARAIAAVGGESAALLLRLKALIGDGEDDVLSDCLAGLLAVEGAVAVPLVSRIALQHESAILALGDSRLPEAVTALRELFERTMNPEMRAAILLAFATSRTEAAIAFLEETIREASSQTAAAAIRAIAIHRANEPIRERIRLAVDSRSDSAIDAIWQEEFNRK